jgi:Predicted membrane protein (DUF2232)
MTTDRPDPLETQARAPVPRLGAAASGLVALLLVGALFVIPFLGVMIAPLGALPVLHYQSGGAPGYRAWGPVAALLLVAAFAGFAGVALPLFAVYSLLVILPSASVGAWVRWRWSEGRWIAVATFAGTAAVLGVVAVVALPLTPMAAVAGWLRAASADAAQMYGTWGLAQGDVELALDAAERAASWMLPGLSVAYLVIVLFWMRPRLPLLGLSVQPSLFEEFRNDDWLAAAFAVSGIGALLLDGTARWVAINLLLAALILYFVQGLAMIRAHLARWFGRGWLVRWGVALLCLQGPMPLLVAVLGVADSFHPLRPRVDDDGGTK